MEFSLLGGVEAYHAGVRVELGRRHERRLLALLLLEPGSLSAQTRAQIETIRNMTLRIHEIMQRFSSLEKEMNVVAQQAEQDSGKSYAAAAAGN